MKLDSLEKLLHDELKDLYSAESQLVKTLPKMVKNANSETLREALESHLEETKGQVERLDRIGEILEIRMTGKKCKAMEGLIEEAKEILESEGEEAVLDAAMIAAGQKVEHYEIASYGTARAMAQNLGLQEVVDLLQATLEEESAADEKLTEIAESEIYESLSADENDEDIGEVEDEEEEEATAPKRRR